jgi:hypothetical protein
MSDKSLGLFKLATGCIAFGFRGLRKALPFTGILALATTAGGLAGALSLAGIGANTMALRRLSGRVRGGIGHYWRGSKYGCRGRRQCQSGNSVSSIHGSSLLCIERMSHAYREFSPHVRTLGLTAMPANWFP